MLLSWLRPAQALRVRKKNQRDGKAKRARNRLRVEELETRLAPATQLLGGLELSTDGTFTNTAVAGGNQVSTTAPVEVGLAPSAGAAFNPLLRLDGGVQFIDSDPAGTFTTTGTVEAIAGGQSFDLLGPGTYSLSATDLLGGTDQVTDAPPLTVAGANFIFSTLGLTTQGVELQGSLSLPKLDGLSLAVTGNDHVILDSSGAHLTGLDASLSNATFSLAGLSVTANDLAVHYGLGANGDDQFTLSGDGSATIAGQEVDFSLGAPQAPGILIDNGTLQSFDATVTTPTLSVGSLTFTASSLELSYVAANASTNTPEELAITGSSSVTFGGADAQTVAVQLGDPTLHTSGLVLENGALESLDLAVTGDIHVAGLDLHADSLRATYTAPSSANGNHEIVTITGGADFKLDGNDVAVQLGDPTLHTAGLIVQDGALQELDAAVTSDITIAGLTINTEALRVTYQADDNNTETITVTGSASIAVDGNSVELQFGNDGRTQGLVIQNGQLTSLDASVSANFTLLGLTVQATDLTVVYAAATASTPETVELYGSLSVSAGSLDNLSANLGTAADPGLELVNGSLEHLNIGVTGSFDLFGVTISANGLTVQYDATSQLLNIEGGATVSLGGLISGGVNLPDGGLTIDTATGALQVHGLEFTLSADFGAFAINNLDVKYTSDANGTSLSLSGEVEFAHEFEVGGSFTVVDGQLTEIGLSYDVTGGTGIAVGDTGVFITHISGEIDNLNDPSKLSVNVGLGLTFGPTVNVLGSNYSLATITGQLTVSASELEIIGNVSLLGGLYGSGTADLKLDWADGIYSLGFNVGMYDNTIEVQGAIAINNSGDIDISAGASLNLPHTLSLFLGNQTLVSANLTLDLNAQNIQQSYAEVTIPLPGNTGSLDLKYSFTNQLHADAHINLLGQSLDVVGNINPDGSFSLVGALVINVAGNSVTANITATNAGFQATAQANILGQTVYVSGTVSSNGTYDLTGTVNINVPGSTFQATATVTNGGVTAVGQATLLGENVAFAGNIANNGTFSLTGTLSVNVAGNTVTANVVANNSGFQATGYASILGQTVYVSGSINSNGSFNLNGTLWINIAGGGGYISVTASNGGVSASGYAYFLNQYVYVSGSIYSGGQFDLSGTVYINAGGIGFYATATAYNGGVYAAGWASVLGSSVYVSGYVYSNGQFDFNGTAWVNAAGFGFEANVSVSNNGFYASGYAWILGSSVYIAGSVSAGWFDLSGSVYFGWAGIGVSAWFNIDPDGAQADAWIDLWGSSIELWGNIYSNGGFSFGTQWGPWSVWVDNSGLQVYWTW